MQQLTTKNLKKMSIKELTEIADQFAARLMFLNESGKHKEDPELYKKISLELFHVAELIEEKELIKIKNNGKKE